VTFVNDSVARVDTGKEFDGVLPVRNVAHDHVGSVAAVLNRGDEITTKVVGHDPERRTAVLSTRVLLPSPYERFEQAHRVGERVVGVVTGFVVAAVVLLALGAAAATGVIDVLGLIFSHTPPPRRPRTPRAVTIANSPGSWRATAT